MRAESERDYLEYMQARLHHLYRTAYLLCGDVHLAEDLVQSTALALYRKWQRVQAADNIDAYVRRVLVNEFLGERRRPADDLLFIVPPAVIHDGEAYALPDPVQEGAVAPPDTVYDQLVAVVSISDDGSTIAGKVYFNGMPEPITERVHPVLWRC